VGIQHHIAAVAIAAFTTSCGTPETNAWLTGVPQQEATEIDRVIHAHTSARILSYSRKPDGTIEVLTDDEHVHTVRRVHGKWEIEHSGPLIL
jgi:hypothetical protein